MKAKLHKYPSQNIKQNAITTVKVLNKTVYINKKREVKSFIKISHHTGIISAEELFLMCSKPVQEFWVKWCLEKKALVKIELDSDIAADTLALKYIIKKYPKVNKKTWLYALVLPALNNITIKNMRRIENTIKFLKDRSKSAKEIITSYESKFSPNSSYCHDLEDTYEDEAYFPVEAIAAPPINAKRLKKINEAFRAPVVQRNYSVTKKGLDKSKLKSKKNGK